MSDRLFILSRGDHQRAKKWEKKGLTLENVLQLFEVHVSRGDKDGPAIVAGALMGPERKAVAIERLSFMIFDVDGTQSVDQVLDIVDKSGKFAIVYTTYSHLKTTDFIKTDQYAKWAARKKQPEKHTTDSVLAYLQDNDKSYLKNVTVFPNPEHTPEGIAIKITHDPVDKLRIVFPLARDFVMADHGYTSAEQIQAWKQTYAGVGEALGFVYDRACMDPARLHFLPAHKEGAFHFTRPYVDRPLLDVKDFAKAEVEKIATAHAASAVAVDGAYATYGEGGATYNGESITDWLNKFGHGTGHVIIDAIQNNDPNPSDPRVRGERGSDKDGVHIQCPFEDEHSQTGGTGTFFDPGPENNFEKMPIIRCMHSHCQGRRTEDFLVKMMIDGWIKYNDLTYFRKHASLARNNMQTQLALLIREQENASNIDQVMLIDGDKEQTEEQRLVVEQLNDHVDKGLSFPPDFLKELAGVNFLDSFDRVFNVAVANSQVLDEPAVRIYALALTPIGIPSLRLYYRQNTSTLKIRYQDFSALITKLRVKNKPLASAIDELVVKNLVNQERREAARRLADFYGMTVREVMLFLQDAEATSGSLTQQELQKRTDALFGHFVVYSDKTQLWFLDPTTNDSDGRKANRIFTKGVLSQRFSNMFFEYQTDSGKKRVELFDWWIKNRRDVKYLDEVAFRPDKPPNDAPNANPMLYNLYEGMHGVKAVKGDASPFYEHILRGWCADDKIKADWIVTWFADIVQNPGNRPASALVIHGGQGTGKSIIFDHCLSKILAPYAVTSNRRDDITGRFNTVLKTTLLFVAEEAVFAGDPQAAAKIKSYVSSDTFTLEAKGQDTSSAKLFSRFAFLTNDFHAMRMDGDDRRYCVVETSNAYKQRTGYFQKLREWFENGGNEIVFHFLLNWKPEEHGLTWGSLYTSPDDFDKKRQKRLSASPTTIVVADLLTDGNVYSSRVPQAFPDAWPLDDEFRIAMSAFKQACVNMVETQGTRLFSARVEVEEKIALCAGYQSVSQVPRAMVKAPNGKHEPCFVFPPRRICLQRAYQLNMVSAEVCLSVTNEPLPEADLTSHLRGALAKHEARVAANGEAIDESAA